MSLATTPLPNSTVDGDAHFLWPGCMMHWELNTISNSDGTNTKSNGAKTHRVEVCEMPHTMVIIPAGWYHFSGPTTCTILHFWDHPVPKCEIPYSPVLSPAFSWLALKRSRNGQMPRLMVSVMIRRWQMFLPEVMLASSFSPNAAGTLVYLMNKKNGGRWRISARPSICIQRASSYLSNKVFGSIAHIKMYQWWFFSGWWGHQPRWQ